MRRGEVYMARLDPVEGSEQAGYRPVVIVGRNSIADSSPVVLAVPCTTHHANRRIYPSHVLLRTPDGGLSIDSIALCEQLRALDKIRLGRLRGLLSDAAIAEIDRALLIALDLPGQN
ncbi:MAG: type II toxin-antitoxin system PemK/MazF family toxin [Dehalococcoidia bacterium]